MKEKLESLFELPLPHRILGLSVLLAAILGGYYFMIFAPLGEELAQVQTDLTAIEDEIVQKKGIAARLPYYEKEVERLDIELAKALRELPDRKEIEGLLAKISDKARDAGLDIKLFQPQGEQRKDFYAEVPVEIEVVGSYHQLATFFDEVGHLERIVNMDQFAVVMDPKKSDVENLKTSVTATSFRFLEENERPKEDEKKGKKRRKGRG